NSPRRWRRASARRIGRASPAASRRRPGYPARIRISPSKSSGRRITATCRCHKGGMRDHGTLLVRDVATRVRQTAMIGLGWTVIGLGVVIAPLPGPFGLPVAAVGATILMRHSPPARRMFLRAKKRAPWPLAGTVRRYDDWRHQRRRRR